MRVASGNESMAWEYAIEDCTLHGLEEVLKLLPTLDESSRAQRAKLLWEALADLEERRGTGLFSGKYSWSFHRQYSAIFDAEFVRQLNGTPWIPGPDGQLESPQFIILIV
jgi:hypothetical protein